LNKKSGRTQIKKMLRAKLLGLAGRMQGIGEQQQSGGNFGLVGAEHAGLAAAVGVSACKHAASGHIPDRRDCVLQAGTVALAIAGTGRAIGAILAKWQIAAEHEEAGITKSVRQRNEQRRLAISASTVREDESVAVGLGGMVQESADERVGGNVGENLRVGFGGH
jgi:hypothetical protein